MAKYINSLRIGNPVWSAPELLLFFIYKIKWPFIWFLNSIVHNILWDSLNSQFNRLQSHLTFISGEATCLWNRSTSSLPLVSSKLVVCLHMSSVTYINIYNCLMLTVQSPIPPRSALNYVSAQPPFLPQPCWTLIDAFVYGTSLLWKLARKCTLETSLHYTQWHNNNIKWIAFEINRVPSDCFSMKLSWYGQKCCTVKEGSLFGSTNVPCRL